MPGKARWVLTITYDIDRDVHEEAEKAFQIFTAGQPGPITMEHLRRVAERLKEDVTDDQLREMLAVACTKEISKGVDLSVTPITISNHR